MKLRKNKIYNTGQALIFSVIFFFFISLMVVSGLVFSTLKGSEIATNLINSKKSYFLAESATEDIVYRIAGGKNYSSEEVISLNGFFATTTISDIAGNIETTTTANNKENIRKIKTTLTTDIGVAFNYGVQAGDGGVFMQNSSSITGNLYSSGIVESTNSNEIYGDVVSSGSSGSIIGIHATGTAYANSVEDSYIESDAHYQSITSTTVLGTEYPDSSDQPDADMPISDEIIQSWKNTAETSIINSPCPYEINDDETLSPVKIACDLEISGSPIITLTGPVWVEGDITIKNSAIIKIDSSLGKKSIPIIADNPSDRLFSSKIELQNSVEFQGSGEKGSYVLVVSQNNSAENDGNEKAILVKNTASGDLLLYTGHGLIQLDNRSDLREVTAYKIILANQANVIYETGLANLLFDSGPGGGMNINSWIEVE